MNNINYIFNSRETYLAARATWKANYARLTTEARNARAEFRDAARAFSKASPYQYGKGAEANAPYVQAEKALWALYGKRANIRAEANAELANLAAMKEEAAAQWEAARAIA